MDGPPTTRNSTTSFPHFSPFIFTSFILQSVPPKPWNPVSSIPPVPSDTSSQQKLGYLCHFQNLKKL